jgi:hypothetical protein
MRKKLIVLASILLFTVFVAAPPVGAGDISHIHFVVVSGDVSAEHMEALKGALLDLAGGYTQVPRTLGASKHDGVAKPEESNTSFLVGADRNIASELKEFAKDKGMEAPFVLVWEGSRN